MLLPIDGEIKIALTEQKEELECKIEKIEIKVEKNTDKINELEKNFAVTNQRLDSIEKGQTKNREIYLEGQNNIKDIMTKNTDSILQMSNSFLSYLANRDKSDTDIKLNKGWNKREIVIAIISAIVSLSGIAWGIAK